MPIDPSRAPADGGDACTPAARSSRPGCTRRDAGRRAAAPPARAAPWSGDARRRARRPRRGRRRRGPRSGDACAAGRREAGRRGGAAPRTRAPPGRRWPAARALDHKLAGPADERRYTCPSLVLHARGPRPRRRARLPARRGLRGAAGQPRARRSSGAPAPESAAEVLAWAREPLATAEVAAVLGRRAERGARRARAGGDAAAAGPEAFWTLEERFARDRRAAGPARVAASPARAAPAHPLPWSPACCTSSPAARSPPSCSPPPSAKLRPPRREPPALAGLLGGPARPAARRRRRRRARRSPPAWPRASTPPRSPPRRSCWPRPPCSCARCARAAPGRRAGASAPARAVSRAAVARALLLAAAFAALPLVPRDDLAADTWLTDRPRRRARRGRRPRRRPCSRWPARSGCCASPLGPQAALEIPEEGPPLGSDSGLAAHLDPRARRPDLARRRLHLRGLPPVPGARPGGRRARPRPARHALRARRGPRTPATGSGLGIPGSPYAVALDRAGRPSWPRARSTRSPSSSRSLAHRRAAAGAEPAHG